VCARRLRMTTSETKTVSRGTLWLVLYVCAALLTTTVAMSASMVRSWASTVEQRGVDNQKRMGDLEQRWAVVQERLRENAEMDKTILELLREHIASNRNIRSQ
jgi:hypothetical protein